MYFSPSSQKNVTTCRRPGYRARSSRAATRCAPELGPWKQPELAGHATHLADRHAPVHRDYLVDDVPVPGKDARDEAVPGYEPYGGEIADVAPHLTVGLDQADDVLESASRAIEPSLPVTARVSTAVLMQGSLQRGSWRVVADLPLAPPEAGSQCGSMRCRGRLAAPLDAVRLPRAGFRREDRGWWRYP